VCPFNKQQQRMFLWLCQSNKDLHTGKPNKQKYILLEIEAITQSLTCLFEPKPIYSTVIKVSKYSRHASRRIRGETALVTIFFTKHLLLSVVMGLASSTQAAFTFQIALVPL
jgi:hypothetical protein